MVLTGQNDLTEETIDSIIEYRLNKQDFKPAISKLLHFTFLLSYFSIFPFF